MTSRIENFELKEIQQKLLEIAKVFHKICEKNQIMYYMLGGTMLGAVRHKGFIPWDDDMDFGVMLDDFPRLKKILREELPSYYKIRTIDNSNSISNSVIKIEDCRYEIVEVEKEEVNDCIGLNIDVFPLSKTGPSEGFLSRNWLAKQLIRVNWCRYLNYRERGPVKYLISKVLSTLMCILPRKLLPYIIEKKIIPHKGNYITNYWDNEIVRDDVMGVPCKYAFEDTFFWGVANTDEYLKRLYGDYMKIPSRDEMHVHIVKCKRRN